MLDLKRNSIVLTLSTDKETRVVRKINSEKLELENINEHCSICAILETKDKKLIFCKRSTSFNFNQLIKLINKSKNDFSTKTKNKILKYLKNLSPDELDLLYDNYLKYVKFIQNYKDLILGKNIQKNYIQKGYNICLLYTSPSPRDRT